MNKSLYKSEGVLWKEVFNGVETFLADNPMCPNQSCHSPLEMHDKKYTCISCNKDYSCQNGHSYTLNKVRRKWEGFQTLGHDIHSLDLPPTKVVDEDNEDDNYWAQARISEKGGKKMAVIYFGQKKSIKQEKKDYTQIFIDFDDEQIRFDKSNKNPMILLSKLTAEFQSSFSTMEKRKEIPTKNLRINRSKKS